MRQKHKGKIILCLLLVCVVILIVRYIIPTSRLRNVVKYSMDSIMAGSQVDNEDGSSGGKTPMSLEVKRANRRTAEYNPIFTQRLKVLIERGAKSRDPELIQLVRDCLDPPSDYGPVKVTHRIVQTPQATEIIRILEKKRGGFFVECGGLDGERSSNTLYLEKELGWTGILIEMDPHYYTQLLDKNRKSWSINACLSPYDYVIEVPFYGDSGGAGRIGLTKNDKLKSVPCFPFESIMLALNQSHVDYFSLDVEGVEFNILRTIPYDRVIIDTLSVEYVHSDSKNATREYMIGQGYRMDKEVVTSNYVISLYVEDFIFVRESLKLNSTSPSKV